MREDQGTGDKGKGIEERLPFPLSLIPLIFNRLFQNPLIRRIVLNFGYLFSAMGISSFMSMLQGVLAARLLGPASFGLLGGITAFSSTVNRFASFRMNELVVRYVSHYQEQSDRQRAAAVFKVAGLLEMGSSLVAFVLVWFLAPVGARYFAHDPGLTPWFRIYGAIVLGNLIYESSTGLLQVFDRFRALAVMGVVQSALTLALIVIVYIGKFGLVGVVLAYMVGKIAGGVFFAAAALLEAQRAWGAGWWRSSLDSLSGEMRSLLIFAISTNASGTISLVAKDSEVLWVLAFLNATQAGYYKLALALVNVLQLPVSPLPKATYPELAREASRKNWDKVSYILRQGSRLSALYTLPAAAGLAIFGRWVIATIYKPEFLPAYPAMLILLVGYTFVNIFYWNRVALLALSRPVYPTLVNFVGMLLKVSAIFLLIPPGGYLLFAVLLSGYYLFTVGLAALRVYLDLKSRAAALQTV